MSIRRLWVVVGVAICLTACAEAAPTLTPTVVPAVADVVWTLPSVPVTVDNVTTMTLLGVDRSTTGTTYAMDFSEDGQYILTVAGDNIVRLWAAETGTVQWMHHDANISQAFFAVDDTQVVLIKRDQSVSVYAVDDYQMLRSFEAAADTIGPAAISPDGRWLAVGTEAGHVIVWDLETETMTFDVEAHIFPLRDLVFSDNGRLLATISAERTVRVWDTASGQTEAVLAGFDTRPYTAAFSPDNGQIAIGLADSVRVWTIAGGQLLQTIVTTPGAAVYELVYSAADQLLGGGGVDVVSVWDAGTGDLYAGLLGHNENFHSMALNPTHDLLVTTALPGHAYLWNMTNPNQRVELSAQEDQVSMVGWTGDGRVLVLAAADGALYFWGVPGAVDVTE